MGPGGQKLNRTRMNWILVAEGSIGGGRGALVLKKFDAGCSQISAGGCGKRSAHRLFQPEGAIKGGTLESERTAEENASCGTQSLSRNFVGQTVGLVNVQIGSGKPIAKPRNSGILHEGNNACEVGMVERV